MSACGEVIARAAEALIGTRFRLHGRSRETGLDCIGLVGTSLMDCGQDVRWPQGYGLRNADIARWLNLAEANGLAACAGPIRRGDILLTRPGPGQHHLLVALGGDRFVHAHAGLRRVVVQHLVPLDPLLAQWRVASIPEQSWPR
ncbi:NlpC/P60 family protein [Qipengyuania qiaonensis]|uniref:NlpC/P60 family protein n=1 Tax=Qipengyuania qiaonensis TaxID=2867240 RepID=UPI001FFDBC67|nr:NlpC/P60 family protein [Qipengyuania qiaonensis]